MPRSLCFLSTQVLTRPGIRKTLEMNRLQETHIIILKISVFENREHKSPVKRVDEKIISKCHFEGNPQDIQLWLTALWYTFAESGTARYLIAEEIQTECRQRQENGKTVE